MNQNNEPLVSKRELGERLFKSAVAGTVFLGAIFAGVLAVDLAPKEEGLAAPLRSVQRFNEKVGRKLFSGESRSPLKPVAPGREPRVNGLIGLDSDVDTSVYRVQVESGTKRLSLAVDELMNLPRTESSTDFKCVEGWTEVFHYAGVSFADFMKAYGVGRHEDGSLYPYVGLETPDAAYFVSLDTASMMHPQTVLVFEMNGGELSIENGFPVRLMVPHKYGIKSLKRVGRIFFSDTRPPDYWNRRGYDWYSGL